MRRLCIRGYLAARILVQVEFFHANAVFVLSNDMGDPEQADDIALLTVKSLKSTAPWVPVHLTLQLQSSAVHRWADWDHVVCAQEMLSGLLAKSAGFFAWGTGSKEGRAYTRYSSACPPPPLPSPALAVPGLCTLVGNLLLSFSDITRRELHSLDSADR